MFKPFRTAAVLGAGVMGTQIAAHLANAGLTVHLLDLPAPSGDKNSLVETVFKKALKRSPPMFFTPQTADRVILGNYDEHFDRLAEVDWVIEAVVEKLEIKRQLMARLQRVVRNDAVISTNTSGLSVGAIASTQSLKFRQRFLGTHFFNPPRYLKLLELIPTADTEPQVLARMQWFGRMQLGKGIVIAKDTPNFIGNRIGIFATMLGLKAFTTNKYTIEEIDLLTGTLVGRPKSGTFRTADVVGLDTLSYVAQNLYPAIPEDERRSLFQVPPLLQKLVDTGTLGVKTGQGFYKKVDGEILSINPETLDYESAKPMHLGNLEGLKQEPDLGKRLRKLYRNKGRAGAFFRQSTLELLAYCANRIPEISDRLVDLDHAMQWGFGWQLGPFQLWDELGFETVIADIEQAGLTLPNWIYQMVIAGVARFYGDSTHETTEVSAKRASRSIYQPGQGYIPLNVNHDELSLAPIAVQPQNTIWQNAEATLLDIGDGVLLYEFRSKANTLSVKVIEGLVNALDILENTPFKGMVIGNDGDHFCVGINLGEVGKMVQRDAINPFNKGHAGIEHLIIKFQTLMQRLHYFHKPIVAATQGRVLGGGCELVMACPHVVASAETYIGLVELGVGLIPAGGGLMRMAAWVGDRAASDTPVDMMPFLKHVFETIGTAKVAMSAQEGIDLGFLSPTTKVVMNGDRRLYVAKQEVLCLDRSGYIAPPKRPHVRVLGEPARATLNHMAYVMHQGGFISEYDRHLADRLAYVLSGGDLSAPALVSEDYLLHLEKDNFLPLIDEPKTQDRILHMLKTKKPLRN